MLNPVKLPADHHETSLALLDFRQVALVNHLTASFPAALIIFPLAFAIPCSRLLNAAVHAPRNKFTNSVLLKMTVVGLHQNEHLIISNNAIAVVLAVFAALQLHNPDALASRSAVLLDHPRLEGHCLLEACLHVFGGIVSQRVWQAKVHVLDLAQSILGTHLCHDIWCRPHGHEVVQRLHILVELVLVSSSSCELSRVDADHNSVETLEHLEELVMLLLHIEDGLATDASINQAIGNRDGVEAVAIRQL